MVPSIGGRGGERREEEEGMALWGFEMSQKRLKSTFDHVILNDLVNSLNHRARRKATTDEELQEGFLCFLFSTIV